MLIPDWPDNWSVERITLLHRFLSAFLTASRVADLCQACGRIVAGLWQPCGRLVVALRQIVAGLWQPCGSLVAGLWKP